MDAVDDLTGHYQDLIDRHHQGLLEGLYLVGSVAMDDYHPGRSDVDFVAVTTRPVSEAEIGPVHAELAAYSRNRPAAEALPYFDGIYVTAEQLSGDPRGLSGPSVHEAKVATSDAEWHPVTWLTLADHGIALRGPAPHSSRVWTSRAAASEWCVANISSYWRPWMARTAAMAGMLEESGVSASPEADWAASWVALGLARMHHTVRTGRIISKSGAAAYARSTFEPAWHPVVDECLALRRGATLATPAGPRLRAALSFAAMVADDVAAV
jgi:hypothetical protein